MKNFREKDSVQRIAIFQYYDEQGIIYDYMRYLLYDLLENVDELHIVCNGYLREESRKEFLEISPFLYERPNVGFDFGAWHYVIMQLGLEYIRRFDELVLLNESFFGPFYPWREVFETMSNHRVDFWGLTAHASCQSTMCPYGYRPRYLQTYFLVFKKNMLISSEFALYWEKMNPPKNRIELTELFEAVLTRHFVDLGFHYGVYADTIDMETDERRNGMSHHMFNCYEMIAHRRLPIIKRKTFMMEKAQHLSYGLADSVSRTMKYIREESEYDEKLIWAYLLKKCNLHDLQESLNLFYVLPKDIRRVSRKVCRRVAIVAHLSYEDLFGYYIQLLEQSSPDIDLIITTTTELKKEKLESEFLVNTSHKVHVLHVENRGREWSARLVACRELLSQYEYLCFVHDKKSMQKEYPTVGLEFGRLMVENLIVTDAYIQNILDRFETEHCLGTLAPPNIYAGTYFHSWKNFWTCNFKMTEHLLQRLGIDPNIDPEKPPIFIGSDFWCRREALTPLWSESWAYLDFDKEPLQNDGALNHALERVVPYIAQAMGFYSAIVMSCETAESEITNLQYMFHETYIREVNKSGCRHDTFKKFQSCLGK